MFGRWLSIVGCVFAVAFDSSALPATQYAPKVVGQSLSHVKMQLTSSLQCSSWKSDQGHATCLSASSERGPIFLAFDKGTHRVKTAEVALLVRSTPPNARSDEQAIRDAVILSRILIPQWAGRQYWIKQALLELLRNGKERQIEVARARVALEELEPNGLEGKYVNLIISLR